MEIKNELISVKETAEIFKCSPTTVRTLIKKGKLHSVKDGIMKLYKSEVMHYKAKKESMERFSPFGNIVLDFDESCKFVDTYMPANVFSTQKKYVADTKYLVTNKGRVINIMTNHVLALCRNTNGYYHVGLQVCKKNITVMVHKLVAILWCANGRFKSEVHHINAKKLDNRPENLIWLTMEEHDEAHRLLKNEDKEIYENFIKKMQEENCMKESIKRVPHPDYREENHFYYMYITERAADILQNGGTWDDIPISEIKGECVVSKEDD